MNEQMGRELGQRARTCNGEVTGNGTALVAASGTALARVELLKLRIIRLARNYEEGLELYQEVWLLLLKRGERLDEFVKHLSRIMNIARKMQRRRQHRLQTEFMQFEEYRRRLLDTTTAGNCSDLSQASDVAEALRNCWQALGEPGQQLIHAILTVQGPIRDQACALGMNTASFLQKKRYLQRAIARAIAVQFPGIVSEVRNHDG